MASITLPSGWSQDSGSSSSDLEVDGPNNVVVSMTTQGVDSNVTLSQVLQSQLSNFDNNSNYTGVEVCSNAASGDVPGTPKVSGADMGICFSFTPQGGSAVPYACLLYDGLVQGNGGQLLVSLAAYVPQSLGTSGVEQEVTPVVSTVRWLQLSSS